MLKGLVGSVCVQYYKFTQNLVEFTSSNKRVTACAKPYASDFHQKNMENGKTNDINFTNYSCSSLINKPTEYQNT